METYIVDDTYEDDSSVFEYEYKILEGEIKIREDTVFEKSVFRGFCIIKSETPHNVQFKDCIFLDILFLGKYKHIDIRGATAGTITFSCETEYTDLSYLRTNRGIVYRDAKVQGSFLCAVEAHIDCVNTQIKNFVINRSSGYLTAENCTVKTFTLAGSRINCVHMQACAIQHALFAKMPSLELDLHLVKIESLAFRDSSVRWARGRVSVELLEVNETAVKLDVWKGLIEAATVHIHNKALNNTRTRMFYKVFRDKELKAGNRRFYVGMNSIKEKEFSEENDINPLPPGIHVGTEQYMDERRTGLIAVCRIPENAAVRGTVASPSTVITDCIEILRVYDHDGVDVTNKFKHPEGFAVNYDI